MTTVGIPTLPARLAERYEVGPVIGRGVGSSVFRAHDTLLGRDAAVKTFRVEADPRAGRELTLLTMMDHPGLVPVYDVEEEDGRAFVVMALLDGGSLASRLDEHGAAPSGLALPLALRTGGTVAGALDHVHRAGVLHRAVTPANVLYDGDGRAHLSDFGVAFVADAPRITDTGLTVGAAPYLAPEQVRGERAGDRADVYALGLVLIEALTGRRAFPGDPLSSAQARLERDPTVPRGLPRPVATLLTAMTASEPEARPDASRVSVALRHALVAAEPLAMPSVLAGTAAPGTAVPARGARGLWTSTRARRFPAARRAPRATGTRGVLVLAGLAASALLAGTVAIATSGPVAEISADPARPAVIVPGGATVGAPDPDALVAAPAVPPPSSGPASGTGTSASDDQEAAPVTTRAPRSEASEQTPVREVAAPARETSSPSRSTSSRPTRTTTPSAHSDSHDQEQDHHGKDDATHDDGDHADGGKDTKPTEPEHEGAVGGVLRGVGGLVDGVLGSGH